MNEQVRQLLLEYADDELVIGWRDSEWTGIAPVLEEDVALSSIAQNEIGHARAIYQLLSDDADALALDRQPHEYLCAPFVQLRFVPDWARTIARRYLYEQAETLRLEDLQTFEPYSDDPLVKGLAAKINREEAYHRMHAQMWADRLRDEPRFRSAVTELLPYALGLLEPMNHPAFLYSLGGLLPDDFDMDGVEVIERGKHADGWAELWNEMTEVRRSVPGAAW